MAGAAGRTRPPRRSLPGGTGRRDRVHAGGDAVVTLSETMRAGHPGPRRDRRGPVAVVPNGVDVERFVPGPRDETLAASLASGPAMRSSATSRASPRTRGSRYLIDGRRAAPRPGPTRPPPARRRRRGAGRLEAAATAARARRRHGHLHRPRPVRATSFATTGPSTSSSCRGRTTGSPSSSRRSSRTRRWRWRRPLSSAVSGP